jgi:hypothetical protein
MMPRYDPNFFAAFNGNPPVTSHVIRRVEGILRCDLPEGYVQFLEQFNGGEGFIGSAYLILWQIEELPELNKAYQVEEYAPDLLLFGSDGGGEAFAFDTRFAEKPIVSLPFVGMELSSARIVGPDFQAFLESQSNS